MTDNNNDDLRRKKELLKELYDNDSNFSNQLKDTSSFSNTLYDDDDYYDEYEDESYEQYDDEYEDEYIDDEYEDDYYYEDDEKNSIGKQLLLWFIYLLLLIIIILFVNLVVLLLVFVFRLNIAWTLLLVNALLSSFLVAAVSNFGNEIQRPIKKFFLQYLIYIILFTVLTYLWIILFTNYSFF